MTATVRNYVVVTAAYWGFTLVDGALRMLVLLHFFQLGYTPFTLAFLFLLYEAAGIGANLGGGWLASRFGIPRMLAVGQTLQIAGLIMLSLLDPGWGAVASVIWVVAAQGIAGVAKDITKTASKSAIKATAAEGSGQLFRWVAWFTGSKNAMKGIGFFIGGLLLEWAGFQAALWLMAGFLAVILVAGLLLLPRALGKAKSSKSVKELFGKSRGVNLLAAARIFMFGARDVWFVVGLPVFLYASGWRFLEVGAFLAAWTIAYGAMQAMAPALVTRSADGLSREIPAARLWAGLLTAVPLVLVLAMQTPESVAAGSCPRYRAGDIRAALRREFVAAFLSDPGLCRIGEGGRGCRLLLCRQRDGPPDGHRALGPALSIRRHDRLFDRLHHHAGDMLAGHVSAAGRGAAGGHAPANGLKSRIRGHACGGGDRQAHLGLAIGRLPAVRLRRAPWRLSALPFRPSHD